MGILRSEYIHKYDTTDDKAEDTLEFTLKKTWHFQPQLSNGLTGDEIVTTLHPGEINFSMIFFMATSNRFFSLRSSLKVLVSMALGVNVDRQGMLPLVATAINEIMHHPKDPFWTGKAMDMIFDGLPLDCRSEDFNAKAVCSIFETGESQQIQPSGNDHFKFSLLAGVSVLEFRKKKTFASIY